MEDTDDTARCVHRMEEDTDGNLKCIVLLIACIQHDTSESSSSIRSVSYGNTTSKQTYNS